MKKIIRVILLVIASIVLLGTIFGTVDYLRTKNNQHPIFILHVSKDGDSHYGLGYVVWINDKCQGDYNKFGPFFSTFACFIGNSDGENVPTVEE